MASNPYKQQMRSVKKQFGTRNPRKLAKQMAYENLAKMRKDPSQFGLSQADRQQMVGEAMGAAGQAAAAQQAGMARQGMGQGGFQAGYMQQAARQIGDAPSKAAAEASMRARQLSEAKIAQAAGETQRRLDEVFRKRMAARQATVADLQAGTEAATAIAEIAKKPKE
jgi:hypothetical protein